MREKYNKPRHQKDNNKIIRDISTLLTVIILLVMISGTLYGFNVDKEKSTKQEITVTVIDSEYNGCGNRMGGFEALYHGEKIMISFKHGRVLTDLELCTVQRQKLSFVDKQIIVVGTFHGKKDFNAEEVYLLGAKRKLWPKTPGNVEYVVTAKKIKRGNELSVYLNNKEIKFRDSTPQFGCNPGQGGPKRYEALKAYEIKMGNKIVDPGLDKMGIEDRLEGPLEGAWNGSEIEIIAKKEGEATLILLYWTPNYCIIHYYIPFVIRP